MITATLVWCHYQSGHDDEQEQLDPRYMVAIPTEGELETRIRSEFATTPERALRGPTSLQYESKARAVIINVHKDNAFALCGVVG